MPALPAVSLSNPPARSAVELSDDEIEVIAWRQFAAELLDRILEARAAGRRVEVIIEPIVTFPKFPGNNVVGVADGRMLYQLVI